jgi:hypothetical protein
MIAEIVVPFGRRNIPSTVSCLDETATFLAGPDFSEVGFAAAATLEFATRFFAVLFFEAEVLRADRAGVDLGLVLAI